MSKFQDLTGQKFGKLVVLGRGKDRISTSKYPSAPIWRVKCKCGEEYNTTKKLLLKNKIKACKKCILKLSDLTGQKFGKLIVLGRGKDYISPAEYKSIRWKAKCEECGKEYNLEKTLLLKEKNHSCNRRISNFTNRTSHNNDFEDLTGQKFGKLTVLYRTEDYISPAGHKSIKWECECDCENTISVIGHSLKANNAIQCKECRHKSSQLNGYISAAYLCNLKYNAKRRNIYFDPEINREYLWDLFLKQNKKCALSNLPIYFAETIRKKQDGERNTASLDRIDSSKGYVKDNIQWTHKHINKMKWKLKQKEFIEICKNIWRHNNEKK